MRSALVSRVTLISSLAILAASGTARASPAVGTPLPAFDVHDLVGGAHTSRELVGRPVFIAVLTSRRASEPTRAWMLHAADRLRGTNARLVTVITLDVSRIVPDAIVRSTARGQVPREQWNATWLDRADAVRQRLGLAKREPYPYVFSLDARGNVLAAAHGAYEDRAARAVFGAFEHSR